MIKRNLLSRGSLWEGKSIHIADELIRSVVSQYERLDLATDKTLLIGPFSESFSLISDEAILRRILGNMVKNAIEATEPGDTVTIKSGIKDGYAVFEVHNPGVIPEKAQTSIFTRFFSTKGPGRGLGTYSIKLLAEGYLGGNVSFSSDKRHGTTFAVAFPTNKTS